MRILFYLIFFSFPSLQCIGCSAHRQNLKICYVIIYIFYQFKLLLTKINSGNTINCQKPKTYLSPVLHGVPLSKISLFLFFIFSHCTFALSDILHFGVIWPIDMVFRDTRLLVLLSLFENDTCILAPISLLMLFLVVHHFTWSTGKSP